jgi:hypothetical protein
VPEYPTYAVPCASNDNFHSFAVFHKEAYQLEKTCQSLVDVPVDMPIGGNLTSLSQMNYTEILKTGFLLTWSAPNCSNCENSGGRCGFDNSEFVCFCLDGDHHKTCYDGNSVGNSLIII